ncbi:MAG: hypothetical protein ACF8LL_07550, partial [Phycisphaerales bacterium]
VLAGRVPLALGAGLCVAFGPGMYNYTWITALPVHEIAAKMLWAPIYLTAFGLAAIGLSIGLVFGRPIARLTIMLLMSPRMRGAFAGLWTCDGLDVPRSGRASRTSATLGA